MCICGVLDLAAAAEIEETVMLSALTFWTRCWCTKMLYVHGMVVFESMECDIGVTKNFT